MIPLGGGWDALLKEDFEAESYLQLRQFLKQEYRTRTVYPPMSDLFNCFRLTPVSRVKCVILGQDPYHGPGQAMGLSFSVPDGVPKPPSLVNIFTEMESDVHVPEPRSGNLSKWAEEGVLLLNTALTVRAGQANSHRNRGWEPFTDSVIRKISEHCPHVSFLLWGSNARSKKLLIDRTKHLIVESVHPSPLSCSNGFFGSRPFSKTNAFLEENGISPINWNLNR